MILRDLWSVGFLFFFLETVWGLDMDLVHDVAGKGALMQFCDLKLTHEGHY